MKKVGGEGVVVARGGILWLILGLTLAASPEVRAACDCTSNPGSYAWLVNSKIRFNNNAKIVGNVGANLPGGLVRFGPESCQGLSEGNPCVGNSVAVSADTLVVGAGTSIAGSESNHLKLGPGSTVRNPPLLAVTLPLVSSDPSSVCGAFADITCGGSDVVVPQGGNAVIPPGTYDTLVVGSGATITLSAGSYSFCSGKIGGSVIGNIDAGTVLNVVGKFSIGAGSVLTTGTTPFVLNSEGTLFRLNGSALLQAEVRVPFGKIRMQRDSYIRGCSCSESMTCGRSHWNICESGSPSGAFLE